MSYEVEVIEHFATVLKNMCEQRAKDINAALRNTNNFYTPMQTERNINACGALLEVKTMLEKAVVEFKNTLPAKPAQHKSCACANTAAPVENVKPGRGGRRVGAGRKVNTPPPAEIPVAKATAPQSQYACASPMLEDIPTLAN